MKFFFPSGFICNFLHFFSKRSNLFQLFLSFRLKSRNQKQRKNKAKLIKKKNEQANAIIFYEKSITFSSKILKHQLNVSVMLEWLFVRLVRSWGVNAVNLTTPVYALKAIEPFPITFVDGNQNPWSNHIAHKRNSHAEHRNVLQEATEGWDSGSHTSGRLQAREKARNEDAIGS